MKNTFIIASRKARQKKLIFSCPACKRGVVGTVESEEPELVASCPCCKREYLIVFAKIDSALNRLLVNSATQKERSRYE